MSFLDHFPGAALDGRWGSGTAGSGAVTVTDSYARLNSSGADTDAAFMYYNQKLTQGSQIWLIACRVSSLGSQPIRIINKATAPVADINSVIAAQRIIQFTGRNGNAWEFQYVDSADVIQRWNHGGSVWQTTGVDSMTPVVADDFCVFGIEFDAEAGASRWRMFAAHKTVASGYSVDQGLRIFALTDWVNWSATRSQASGLWLVIGDLWTEIIASDDRVEWVRHADGPRQYLYTNAKDAESGNYGIRTSWGYDGKFFVPQDRTTVDVANVKDPWVVFDGTTYHMFYQTMGTAPDAQLRRATASSPLGPWSEQNTLASPGADHAFAFPHVLYTPWEVSGREWQCLMTDVDLVGAVVRIRLLTASTPGGTWTDQGVVLDVGSGGQYDEQGWAAAVPLHRNGQYEVWGTTKRPSGGINFLHETGARATGASLTALTKDGVTPRLPVQDQVEALDANLDGSTVVISDTSGFAVDLPVYLNQDATGDNWSGSRIRKVTTNTSLELYHRLMGFTTANGAKVFGALAGNQQIRDIVRVGFEWWVYVTTFNHAKLDSTFVSFQEELSLLIVPDGTDLLGMAPSMYSWIDSPIVLRGSWSNIRSNENSSLIHLATPSSIMPSFTPNVLRPRLFAPGHPR